MNLKELAVKIPSHYICEKRLWCGNVFVDIEHIDKDLNKPLDYISAFEKMINKLGLLDG